MATTGDAPQSARKPRSVFSAASDGRTDGLQTLILGLKIIEYFARQTEPVGVTQVANALSLPKARAHRYLSTLRDMGYLLRDPATDRYKAGWGLYILSQDVSHHFALTRFALPVMEALRDEIDKTVVLSTYSGTDFVVLDFVPQRSPLEMGLRPGSRFKVNAAAQGKIALAFGDDDLLERVIGEGLGKLTDRTVDDPEALRDQVARIRERGWADAPDELFPGINAVAVPIFGQGHHLLGALAAVSTTVAMPPPPGAELVAAIQAAAGRISQALGVPPQG